MRPTTQASPSGQSKQPTQGSASGHPGAVVLDVRGELDTYTAPRLTQAISEALGSAADQPVVVDLTRLTFFGSAGIAVLTSATREAANRAGSTALRLVVEGTQTVLRPIEVTGLEKFLPLHRTVADALTN